MFGCAQSTLLVHSSGPRSLGCSSHRGWQLRIHFLRSNLWDVDYFTTYVWELKYCRACTLLTMAVPLDDPLQSYCSATFPYDIADEISF
jgi:hypothetical protein